MLTLAALEDASHQLKRFMAPTSLFSWPLLNDALGCEVFIKHENHAPTGSFKARCALTYLLRQSERHVRSASFVAATRGNFGLGMAWAARSIGQRAAIVVPQGTSKEQQQRSGVMAHSSLNTARILKRPTHSPARWRRTQIRFLRPVLTMISS